MSRSIVRPQPTETKDYFKWLQELSIEMKKRKNTKNTHLVLKRKGFSDYESFHILG